MTVGRSYPCPPTTAKRPRRDVRRNTAGRPFRRDVRSRPEPRNRLLMTSAPLPGKSQHSGPPEGKSNQAKECAGREANKKRKSPSESQRAAARKCLESTMARSFLFVVAASRQAGPGKRLARTRSRLPTKCPEAGLASIRVYLGSQSPVSENAPLRRENAEPNRGWADLRLETAVPATQRASRHSSTDPYHAIGPTWAKVGNSRLRRAYPQKS